jgi:hypothetical protein
MYTNITSTWYAPTKRPEAFITKAKKRIKQFDGKVYLNDGDEYEIELFNPTLEVVLAKIKIDGDYIAGGGIVLRRGERVFLERFLDSPERFKFSTYEVNGKNVEVQNAIANNGYVEIEFYSEHKPFVSNGILYGNSTSTNLNLVNGNPITFTTTSSGGATFLSSTLTSGTTTNTFYNASLNAKSLVADKFDKLEQQKISHLSDRKMETGTTERGSDSNQTFQHTNKTFNSFSFWNVAWQILPNSQKQYTVEELNVNYCGNCGAKRKKSSFKFCPHCGNKF